MTTPTTHAPREVLIERLEFLARSDEQISRISADTCSQAAQMLRGDAEVLAAVSRRAPTPTNEAPSLEGLAEWLREQSSILNDNKNFAIAARKLLRWASAVDSLTAAPAPANPDEFGVDEYIAPQDAETKSAIRFEEWMYQARELIRDREQAYLAWRNGRDNDPSEVLFDAYQLAKLSLSAHLAKRIAPAPTDAQIEEKVELLYTLAMFCHRNDEEKIRRAIRAILRATPSPEGST